MDLYFTRPISADFGPLNAKSDEIFEQSGLKDPCFDVLILCGEISILETEIRIRSKMYVNFRNQRPTNLYFYILRPSHRRQFEA